MFLVVDFFSPLESAKTPYFVDLLNIYIFVFEDKSTTNWHKDWIFSPRLPYF